MESTLSEINITGTKQWISSPPLVISCVLSEKGRNLERYISNSSSTVPYRVLRERNMLYVSRVSIPAFDIDGYHVL